MNNNYHSFKIFILAFILFETYAQVPIQYYDFELNSDRTQVETTAEIIINSISGSAVTSEGGIIVNASGNPSSGSAIRRDDWDENGLFNPGVNALDYIQFSANTSGFSGITVKADITASSSFQVLGEINLLYSIDGGSTFFQSSPEELSNSFEQYNWNLSSIPGLNNNPNVIFRLYGYGNISAIGNGTITIDNLYVSAQRISESKTLGNYQLIDDANGTALFPVFNDFSVNGLGIIVNLESDLRFHGDLRLLNGIIATNSNRVVMQENSDLTGGDSNAYIAGSLSLFAEIDDSPVADDEVEVLFPIGSLSGYHPVKMVLDDDDDERGEDFIEITVTQFDMDPFPASLPSNVDKISSVRFWRIQSPQSLGDFDLTLHWAADDMVLDMENLTIAYGTANGAWTSENNNGGYTGNPSSGSITGSFNGLQGDYTFGNLNGGGNPLPIELSSFKIRIIKNNAHLSWSTDSEINSYKFVIQRMSSEDMNWRNAGEVFASGNSNSPKHYSFIDKNLESNFYSYKLKMIDNDGTFKYSNELHTEINIADEFELSQNYPNPFNPATIITYKLPEKSHVSLQIFNILGNEIAKIINEEKPAGVHKVEVDISVIAPALSNGTYFYRLKAGSYTETKKMIYIK